MSDGPEDVIATYTREAADWAAQRAQNLWERPALEACVAGRNPGLEVLDLGCGSGAPIARWFADRGDDVTGVDAVPEMIAIFRANVPEAQAVDADMRGLNLQRPFDIILAFNSFFHLGADDQAAMFPVFAAHARTGTRLLFTSGPAAGSAMGTVGASAIYHYSHAPDTYRDLLAKAGFAVVWFRPEDANLRGHSVWLAEFTDA